MKRLVHRRTARMYRYRLALTPPRSLVHTPLRRLVHTPLRRRAFVLACFSAALLSACRLEERPAGGTATSTNRKMSTEFLGLRTARYAATDLAAAKAWYSDVLGIAPYFDQPFYVGFNVGGFELGITPDSTPGVARIDAGIAYWGVADAETALARLVAKGATVAEALQDVGEGIKVAAVRDPFGNVLGIIENPVYHHTAVVSPGPGR